MGKKKKKGGLSYNPSADDSNVSESTEKVEESEETTVDESDKSSSQIDTQDESNEETEGVKTKETKGQMVQRHKRELKELKKKTQDMLHSFNRSDKNAKKQTQEAIKKLEDEMQQKHAKELAELDKEAKESSQTPSIAPQSESESKAENAPTQKVGKAKKRRDAKAAKEREREAQIAEEKKNVVSDRDLENKALQLKLAPLRLKVKEIYPDGNCLYSAVADQLTLQAHPTKDYRVLRSMTAEYMRQHSDEFIPFIETEDGDLISQDGYEKYCKDVESTTTWGGQLELKAMVHCLKTPITIFIAGDNSPDIEMGAEYEGTPLRLSFHKKAYSLGEHYNSVVPVSDDEEEEDD